jgi:hypothetical protein
MMGLHARALIARERFLSDHRVLDGVRLEIERVFGEGISVDFQMLQKIDRDPTGKLKIVISHMPQRAGDGS